MSPSPAASNWRKGAAVLWRADPLGTISLGLLSLAVAPWPALILVCTKRIIDGVSLCLDGEREAGLQQVVFYAVCVVGAELTRQLIEAVQSYRTVIAQQRVSRHVQEAVLNHAVLLDLVHFETPAFHDKLRRAQSDVAQRPTIALAAFFQILSQACVISSYLFTLWSLAFWAPLSVFLVGLPSLIMQRYFGIWGWSLNYERTQRQRKAGYISSLLASPRLAKEIRLYGFANHLLEGWRELFYEFQREDRHLLVRKQLVNVSLMLAQTLCSMAFLAYVIYRTLVDPLVTLGSLFMYTKAMDSAVGTLRVIVQGIGTLYENSLYINNLFEYLEMTPFVQSPAEPIPLSPKIRHGIRFENVTFSYPNELHPVLVDVSLEINPGEKIAFVGENGAGKTTLVKLLARLYDPQDGMITVDSIDIKRLDVAEWHRRIAVVLQDFGQYALSARENIGLGNLECVNDIEQLRRAASFGGAVELIESLNHGWDTILGKVFDEGQELSVGQWQRIAISRAFARDAEIVILDEPTASLDPKQEYLVYQRLKELTRDKITILISHRLSSVRMADRIYVIEQGHITESGSHDQLLEHLGTYAELFERQSAAYR
jgi:ATP-binding cassette subfamily B protein